MGTLHQEKNNKVIEIGKFANAIGILEIKVGEKTEDIKPVMKDVRAFRDIVTSPDNKKNKKLMFDKFSDFMFELIERFNPDEDKVELREYVEVNINPLLETVMIGFKWTTKEELKQSNAEALKKLMSDD